MIVLPTTYRYEAKRLEVETWLSRMENRSERMGTVATTADVLEAQQKEQKVKNASFILPTYRSQSIFVVVNILYTRIPSVVLPRRTPSIQASNRVIQPIDAKTHQSVSDGRYVTHQTNDRGG